MSLPCETRLVSVIYQVYKWVISQQYQKTWNFCLKLYFTIDMTVKLWAYIKAFSSLIITFQSRACQDKSKLPEAPPIACWFVRQMGSCGQGPLIATNWFLSEASHSQYENDQDSDVMLIKLCLFCIIKQCRQVELEALAADISPMFWQSTRRCQGWT